MRWRFGEEEAIWVKLIERCAGIDIGKRFLVCCVMTGAAPAVKRGALTQLSRV
jgi:hypothetical protein